jgi:hypothetical protein
MSMEEANEILVHFLDMIEILYFTRGRDAFREERRHILHNFYQQCRDMGIKKEEE